MLEDTTFIAPDTSNEVMASPPAEDAVRAWAAQNYERCHPGDSFADLVGRARFSKEDRRLMEDWLAAARRRVGGRLIGPALNPDPGQNTPVAQHEEEEGAAP